MRPKWFKALLATALTASFLGLTGLGQGAQAYNRSQVNSLFKQAYGNCSRLRALGYNPSNIEKRLRWAQGQLNNYWANPSSLGNFPRTPYGNKELQTINPFGDYVFHGTNIRNHGGKLQTRSLDPTGIVARAQQWAKELRTITKKAEIGGGAREFKQDINEALAFLGAGPSIPTGGSLGQQADSQLGALTGNPRSDSSGLPGQDAQAGGGQFHNPYAGDPSVVDLSQSKTLTPSLLRDSSTALDATGQAGKAAASPPTELRRAIESDPKSKDLHERLLQLEAEKAAAIRESVAARDGALADMSKFELMPGAEGRLERMAALAPEAAKDGRDEALFSKFVLANKAVLGEAAKPVKMLWDAKDWAARPWFEHTWAENVDFTIENQPVPVIEWTYRAAKAYTGFSVERYQDYQGAVGRTAMRLNYQKQNMERMRLLMERIKKNRQELSRATGMSEDQLAAYYKSYPAQASGGGR